MVGCATDTRTRRQASAVDCVRGRLSVLVSRVCVCHQPIPHDARECIVGLRSAAVTPIAPPSVVCRVSDVGARLRLVWAASAEYYCYGSRDGAYVRNAKVVTAQVVHAVATCARQRVSDRGHLRGSMSSGLTHRVDPKEQAELRRLEGFGEACETACAAAAPSLSTCCSGSVAANTAAAANEEVGTQQMSEAGAQEQL